MWDAIGGLASGIGNYFAAQQQRGAAEDASFNQQQAIGRAMDLQGQQFDFQRQQLGGAQDYQNRALEQIRATLAPYIDAGQGALGGLNAYAQAGQGALRGQQALAGLLSREDQGRAIESIQASPEFGALTQQGENAIRQNASATGGLRGGNIQAALAQFRPQILSQLINQRYAQLGGIAGLGSQNLGALAGLGQFGASGQAAAYGSAAGAQAGLAGQIANASGAYGAAGADLYGQQGASQAGNSLAQGKAGAGLFGGLGGNINQWALVNQLRGWGGLGAQGSTSPYAPQSTGSAIEAMKGWGF